jgi:hypothetical protein
MRRMNLFLAAMVALVNTQSVFALNAQTLIIDGSRPEQSVKLTDQEGHWTYRQEEYLDTCWTREFAGYRQECHNTVREYCSWEDTCVTRPDGSKTCNRQRVCRNVPDTVCREVPVYRDVAYSCTKVRTVRDQYIIDAYIDADITVRLGELPATVKLDEQIQVSLSGLVPAVSVSRASGNVLIFATKEKTDYDERGGRPVSKSLDVTYRLDFVDLRAAAAPILGGEGNIEILELVGNTLKLTLPKVQLPEFLALELKIEKSKALLPDPNIVDQRVPADALVLRDLGDRTEVTILLSKLSMKEAIGKGKYNVTLTVKVESAMRSFLNPSSLPMGGALKAPKKEFKIKG